MMIAMMPMIAMPCGHAMMSSNDRPQNNACMLGIDQDCQNFSGQAKQAYTVPSGSLSRQISGMPAFSVTMVNAGAALVGEIPLVSQ